MDAPTTIEVLERMRRGEPLTGSEVDAVVRAWDNGSAGDAQMGAWCMAVARQGLEVEGAVALGRALIASGERLDLARFGPVVDLQSVGGVGDSSLLVAAPIAASLGVRVAGLHGPGLGVMGGTLDLLDSVPGVQTSFDLSEIVRLVRDEPVVLGDVHDRICPAERRLWGIRLSTGTGDVIELALAATVARALAFGAPSIVVHIPVGMGNPASDGVRARHGEQIAHAFAAPFGRNIRVVTSEAPTPLSNAVGPLLEVRQASAVLRGEGPDALREAAILIAGAAAELAGIASAGDGPQRAREALANGSALAAAKRWITSQGGDGETLADTRSGGGTPILLDIPAERDGVLSAINAVQVGEAARWVGAGRMHPTQFVDHATGIGLPVTVGMHVSEGDALAWVHARDEALGDRAVQMLTSAFVVADAPDA